MGASSIALFARVGGGIYTKAADVGADLVGKVEAGIPEDDPRNPGVIADNVGDNVGDVAGMGADLFESFVGAILSAVVIAMTTLIPDALEGEVLNTTVASAAVGFVFAVLAAGVVASIAGVFAVRVKEGGDPQAALRQGTILAGVVFAALVFVLALAVFGNVEGVKTLMWAICVISGLLAGLCIGFTAEHFTSGKVVEDLAEQSDTQPTNIIAGLAIGFRSAVLPLVIIAAAVMAGYLLGNAATEGGGLFGVTLAAVGMLGTLGITVGVDAYGPIADNAGGIAEMSPPASGGPGAHRRPRRGREHHGGDRQGLRHRLRRADRAGALRRLPGGRACPGRSRPGAGRWSSTSPAHRAGGTPDRRRDPLPLHGRHHERRRPGRSGGHQGGPAPVPRGARLEGGQARAPSPTTHGAWTSPPLARCGR